LGEHCTGIAEVVGSNPAQSLKFFSGLCSSSVTAAFALITVRVRIIYRHCYVISCDVYTLCNAINQVQYNQYHFAEQSASKGLVNIRKDHI